MKIVLHIFILFSLMFLSGCQLFEDSPELQEKKQELALKKLLDQQEKELASIELQMSLANIEKEKVLELQKLQNEIKSQELNVNSEKELELIGQKISLQESNNTLTFQMYILIFAAVVIILIAFFFFYFLKKKREDELRAYNDNLKKYFYFKENESRVKIAEKILDTISQGDLSKDNEQKLINAFTNEASVLQTDTSRLAADKYDYEDDAEIITEETSAEQTATASFETIEHKDKNERD